MDYFNINSELTDTLDFLTPPVQRGCSNFSTARTYVRGYNGVPHNTRLLKDFRTNVKLSQSTEFDKSNATGTPSLILTKTAEREILQQYSTKLLHRSQYESPVTTSKLNSKKPLIKITVIPKNSTQTQTLKSRKRRQNPKRVQSTVSNQENSITAKNIYFVVTGRKREKIYEVKTAGSAEFSNQSCTKDDNVSVEQVRNIKQLLRSLNMDKKKKKGKIKEVAQTISKTSLVHDVFEDAGLILPETSNDLRTRKSRVRITGKIGLSEDDRMIMKCDATLDGQPIPSNFEQVQQALYEMAGQQFKINRNQKDSNIQADFKFEKSFNAPLRMNFHSDTENQATQTDLNSMCFSNIETLRIFSNNDRCRCQTLSNIAGNEVSGLENESETLNCTSPLVIISVYPKRASEADKNEKRPIKDSGSRSPQRPGLNTNTSTRTSEKPERNINKKDTRHRSPSPSRPPKPRADKPPETKISINRTKAAKEITKSQPTTSRAAQPYKGDIHAAATLLSKAPLPSFKSANNQTIETSSNKPHKSNKIHQETKMKIKFPSTLSKQSNKKQQDVGSAATKSKEHGTVTDPSLTKKAIVETYTKKITEHMNKNKPTISKWGETKHDVSNIKINVDAEKEYYDFFFRQGNLTTDLRFRKTVKDQGSQKYFDEEYDKQSLENFLLTDEIEPRKRSYSQIFEDQSNDELSLPKHISRLNVRDSLEICHRKEERNSFNGAKRAEADKHDTDLPTRDTNNFAVSRSKSISTDTNTDRIGRQDTPVKHFRGDKCSILDPVQRDKEIRELLGVRVRPATSKPTTVTDNPYAIEVLMKNKDQASSGDEQSPVQCYYQLDKRDSTRGCDICSFYKCSYQKCGCEPCPKENEDDEVQSHIPEHGQAMTPDNSPGSSSNHSSQCTCDHEHHETPMYQQLILNRNINVYLQIEQFTKRKPIILSRKQYEKVKRTIEVVGMKSPRHRQCICKKYSSFSAGEVRRKETISGRKYKERPGRDREFLGGRDGPHSRKPICRKECFNGGHYQDRGHYQKREYHQERSHHKKREYHQDRDHHQEREYHQDRDHHQEREYHHDRSHQEREPEHYRESSGRRGSDHRREPLEYMEPKHESFGSGESNNHKDFKGKEAAISRETSTKIRIDTTDAVTEPDNDFVEEIESPCNECPTIKKTHKKMFHFGSKKPKKDKKKSCKSCDCGAKMDGDTCSVCNKKNIQPEDLCCGPGCNFACKTQDLCTLAHLPSFTIPPIPCCPDSCFPQCGPQSCGLQQPCHPLPPSCGPRPPFPLQKICPCCGNSIREQSNYCSICGISLYQIRNSPESCQYGALYYQTEEIPSSSRKTEFKSRRQTASSVEIRYTEVAYTKHVTFSSTAVGASIPFQSSNSIKDKQYNEYKSDSIHTIFKGHRRCPTPNLGTSVYSLCSDYSDMKSPPRALDQKPRKPFLRRLMSCLVMRSSRVSEVKVGKPEAKVMSMNSSVDSYHISTSLGAIELSSSIYDTSASFYSNHTIMPINSKMKRGFLSSMRGFLTSRRS